MDAFRQFSQTNRATFQSLFYNSLIGVQRSVLAYQVEQKDNTFGVNLKYINQSRAFQGDIVYERRFDDHTWKFKI